MASLKETLISLAEEQDKFGQDSSETRQRIMELDRTEKLQQQAMNPSVLQRAGNFISKLGNVPNVINQNFTGFLNPSPTLDDFSFIKGEQDRIQATLNAQKIADQQADFNRLGLALSLIDGSTSTKPGFNLEPVRDTLNRISQGMMQQRALAPELEFNRRMRPYQLAMADAQLKNQQLANFVPNPPQPNNVPQSSTSTTRNVTGFDGNLDPNNTGFGFRGSPQNIQSDSQISSRDRVNQFVNNVANRYKPVFPEGMPYGDGKLYAKHLQKEKSFNDITGYVTGTLENLRINSPQLYDEINENDVLSLFQIHSNALNDSDARSSGLIGFRNKLLERVTKSNLPFSKTTFFSASNRANPSLFSYKQTDLSGDQISLINKLNNIYTEYTGSDSDFAKKNFNNQLNRIKKEFKDFNLDDFKSGSSASKIHELIENEIIKTPQSVSTQTTGDEPTTDTVTQEEDLVETQENVQQENKLDRISESQSTIEGAYQNPYFINATINSEDFVGKSFVRMEERAIKLAEIKRTSVDTELEKLQKDYEIDTNLISTLVPSQTEYIEILDNLLALDDEEWAKVSLPDTNIVGQKVKEVKNFIVNPSDLTSIASLLKQLSSSTFIQVIERLKNASNTGSTGLGALSNREGKIITDTIGELGLVFNENNGTVSLKQMPTRVLKATIQRIKNTMTKKVEGTKAYMYQSYGVSI